MMDWCISHKSKNKKAKPILKKLNLLDDKLIEKMLKLY